MVKDKQKIYDNLSYKTSINLYSLNKARASINLYGFNYKNEEHKYIFEIAVLSGNIFNKEIRLEANLFTRLYLSWKYRKSLHFIKKCKWVEGEETVDNILEFMRPAACAELEVEHFNFWDIIKE